MDFSRRLGFVLVFLVASLAARAQSTVPTQTQGIPAQTIVLGGGPLNIDLRNYFNVPGITGQVAQFDTSLGRFNVELLAGDAPLSVANFLSYVGDASYSNSFIHRSTPLGPNNGNRIVQGGGYVYTPPSGNTQASVNSIPRKSAIALEFKLPNVRGTLAMARTAALNSATSEWFFNVDDNTDALGAGNNGGYAVFARVLGSGMSVVDAIAALPTYNIDNSTFSTVPLRDVTPTQTDVTDQNFIKVNSVTAIPIYPTAASTKAVLEFSNFILSGGGTVVSATLSGSTLVITPLAAGTATLSVRAADANNNAVSSGNFLVTVTSGASAPVIAVQPVSQTIATGSTAAFNVTATGVPTPTYQWKFNGADISGATGPRLVLPKGTAQAGNYSVVVMNASGSVPSNVATLSLNSTIDVGRLTNLSVLAPLTAAVPEFTVATVIGGGSSGTKPLLVRAAGPALGQLGVGGFVLDPKAEFYAGSTLTDTNDNWGGSTILSNAFTSVGAFGYGSTTSKDAAFFFPATAPGSYSVKVSGVGGATGLVIAELYDAAPAGSYTTASHRFLDVSVLKQIDANDFLTVGFNIGGSTARTVLVRAAGPALGDFGVPGTMPDPQLDLYSGQTVLASNDNWGGDAQVNAVFTSVGAFAFTKPASKDAVVIATLAPGNYTAVVRGVNGSAGSVIVEVYDVP